MTGPALTLGSLFDGIGVFPLAARRQGITPLWASEIEKAPVSITKRHFPDMAHLGDITKLDGGKIPPVHVISFGSPCQNLSQIGNRSGLAGAKSSLFYEAIRIIQEMRDATGGKFPIIALWENVMGAFSSSNRMDLKPSYPRSQASRFQCLLLDAGQTPEWCEGDALTSRGGSWTPSIGQSPGWPGDSASSSWRILEGGVLPRYCLSPGQCSRFLKLAARAGCPPPVEIEALFLKQGGEYPSPGHFKCSVCGERPRTNTTCNSGTASDCQLTLFPLF